jgi:hypothetical protein
LRDSREVIARPLWGVFRQGVVFSGAVADGYTGCDVAGLIITAHCDLAHDKVPVVNFIPVVRVADWLLRDYAHLLSKRLFAEGMASIAEVLRQAGLSTSLLETETIATVAQLIDQTALLPKVKERAATLCNSIELCAKASIDDVVDKATAAQLVSVNPKLHRRTLRELMEQTLGGYYFLPNTDPVGEHTGFVVLFRQVYHLPREIASRVAGGISGEELQQLFKEQPFLSVRLQTDQAAFAMPIGQILSPYLEHLMQQFGLLYTRIGVTDLADPFIVGLTEKAAGGSL